MTCRILLYQDFPMWQRLVKGINFVSGWWGTGLGFRKIRLKTPLMVGWIVWNDCTKVTGISALFFSSRGGFSWALIRPTWLFRLRWTYRHRCLLEGLSGGNGFGSRPLPPIMMLKVALIEFLGSLHSSGNWSSWTWSQVSGVHTEPCRRWTRQRVWPWISNPVWQHPQGEENGEVLLSILWLGSPETGINWVARN